MTLCDRCGKKANHRNVYLTLSNASSIFVDSCNKCLTILSKKIVLMTEDWKNAE